MGKTLVIAEKPSVARDIAKVLGASEQADGCLIGTKYIVSWAIGHLVTLAEPEAYDVAYRKWSFDTLPILPEKMKLQAISKTRSQLRILHHWLHSREIDDVICATDSGREGELIFRYIYEITKCKKPFRRLWISSMTESAIRDGFAHLKAGAEYDLLYHSAQCRAIADWLVGMNASRAYTIQYNALLSIGRVQTPTLAMIVQRQQEIDTFVSQTYYEVQANFGNYTGIWIDEKAQSKIEQRKQAEEIAARSQGKQGTIKQIEQEEKQQLPPLLYDLTELQRVCNRVYGFSAKKTLDIAQTLYEKRKMITYPRTDSRYLSTDMKDTIKQILNRCTQIDIFAKETKEILSLPRLPLQKRIIDDSKVTDHHAIIPTNTVLSMEKLTEDEKKVFQLIVARFLSVFYPPYRYQVTKVYTQIQQDLFLSKGKLVLQEGWYAIEQKITAVAKKQKDKEEQLPALQKGQSVTVKHTEVLEKQTKPPTAYTESTLLSAMEHAGRMVEDETLREQMKEGGLGTPATRAAIIERLIQVGYIYRKGKSLLPTEKGKNLIAVVPEQLRSPETTGKWEKGLSSIAKGRMTQERFLESIQRFVQFLVTDAQQNKKDVLFEAEPVRQKGKRSKITGLGKCPACKKGKILENTKAYYCSEWKQGCHFTIWKSSTAPYDVTVEPAQIRKLLKGESVGPVSAVLPQTQERGTATLVLSKDGSGKIELMGFTRI